MAEHQRFESEQKVIYEYDLVLVYRHIHRIALY